MAGRGGASGALGCSTSGDATGSATAGFGAALLAGATVAGLVSGFADAGFCAADLATGGAFAPTFDAVG